MDLFASISPFRTAVRIHRSIAWKKTLTIGKKELGTTTTTITVTNWSPTGQQVVVGLENGSVRVFTLEGGIERACFLKAHTMPVTRIVWVAQQQRSQPSEQDEVCCLLNVTFIETRCTCSMFKPVCFQLVQHDA
jgi:Anaphase-promoting complex subunit 4 WD40 domain